MLSLREILFVLYIPYKVCVLAARGALWVAGKLGRTAARAGRVLAGRLAERREADRLPCQTR